MLGRHERQGRRQLAAPMVGLIAIGLGASLLRWWWQWSRPARHPTKSTQRGTGVAAANAKAPTSVETAEKAAAALAVGAMDNEGTFTRGSASD
jgi:hypothetical protein